MSHKFAVFALAAEIVRVHVPVSGIAPGGDVAHPGPDRNFDLFHLMEDELAKASVEAVEGVGVVHRGSGAETVRYPVLHKGDQITLQARITDVLKDP